MQTGFKMSFKQQGWGLFFLLLSLQLHLLLARPQTSMVADLNREKNVRETIVPKELSVSAKVGDRHEFKAVGRRGGGGTVGTHGGVEPGNGGDAAGNNGGGTKSPDGQGAGAVIPVYAAGANHNRDNHHHGRSSGTINCIGSSCLVLTLLTSFFFVFYI